MNSDSPASRTTFAFTLMLLAFFCFAAMDTSAKWLVAQVAIPVAQVAFLRYVGHLFWSLVWYAPRGGPGMLHSKIPCRR